MVENENMKLGKELWHAYLMERRKKKCIESYHVKHKIIFKNSQAGLLLCPSSLPASSCSPECQCSPCWQVQ